MNFQTILQHTSGTFHIEKSSNVPKMKKSLAQLASSLLKKPFITSVIILHQSAIHHNFQLSWFQRRSSQWSPWTQCHPGGIVLNIRHGRNRIVIGLQWQFFESFPFNHLKTIKISEEMISGLDIGVNSHDQFLIILWKTNGFFTIFFPRNYKSL